jgi:hypothetical protein
MMHTDGTASLLRAGIRNDAMAVCVSHHVGKDSCIEWVDFMVSLADKAEAKRGEARLLIRVSAFLSRDLLC